MKTLDEVIDAMEKCISYGNSCLNCPYDKGNRCLAKSREKDCLYYLRQLKNLMYRLEMDEL